jgi:hypothetical protein
VFVELMKRVLNMKAIKNLRRGTILTVVSDNAYELPNGSTVEVFRAEQNRVFAKVVNIPNRKAVPTQALISSGNVYLNWDSVEVRA